MGDQKANWIWDSTNGVWVKLAGTAEGAMSIHAIVESLDDIEDVNVPTPGDGEALVWDDATSMWIAAAPAPAAHHLTHENGVPDEISVAGLSGLLADDQHVLDTEAVSAMGVKADNNPLNHDRYADAAAVSAMGAKADNNPLNHDKYLDAAAVAAVKADAGLPVVTITFIIDGGGAAITTGQKGHLEIPFACTINRWTLMADVAGAIVIDIWKDTYANFPPTDADAMPGAGKEPTIAATNQKAQDTDVTDWTDYTIDAGDIIAFNVDSCTTITRVTLSLKCTKS